ncbi:MAG: IclR family transcriptional regulator [Betaproteobacteria bacterium]
MDTTLLKGLWVLEALSDSGDSCSIEDVAQRAGLGRSNAHRTLQTLMHAGYVERDFVNGGYRSTMKMFSLGIRQLGRLDVHRLARPYMTRLARDTEEMTTLSILEGAEVVYIDKIDSGQAIGAVGTVGNRAPAHATATGKALLAAEGIDSLRRLGEHLDACTRSTIVERKALTAELARIARVGYAVDRCEWRAGLSGIAAPVFNGLARPVAALGICGPLERMSVARIKQLAPLVVDIAGQLSKALGYAPESAREPATA